MGLTAVGAPDTPATADEQRAAEVAALLNERAGYVARGLEQRVAQVDEQLRLRGARPPK